MRCRQHILLSCRKTWILYGEELYSWECREQYLVQILVEVASIQLRTLKAEVETVSMRTSFEHGLVGPKGSILLEYKAFLLFPRKGMILILINLVWKSFGML